jgi:hypothetical protein
MPVNGFNEIYETDEDPHTKMTVQSAIMNGFNTAGE